MQDPEAAAELKKKRAFRKFSYRGIDLDQYVAKHSPPPFLTTDKSHGGTDDACFFSSRSHHRHQGYGPEVPISIRRDGWANPTVRNTDSSISPRTSSAMLSMPAPAEGSTVV
jgi:hypothetical protein